MTQQEALDLLDEIIGDIEAAEASDRFAGLDYVEPQLRRGVAGELAELRRVFAAATKGTDDAK